jgi:K+-transporting ATPase KdpF subunit
MPMIVNKGKTELLPIKPCCREGRRPGRQLALALAPIPRPNRLRELIGGRLMLLDAFAVLALVFIVGYLILCILGGPKLSSPSPSVAEVRSTSMPAVHTMAAFVGVGLFVYLTVALLRADRSSY